MVCKNSPDDVGAIPDANQDQHIASIRHRSGRFGSRTRVQNLTTSTRNGEITTVRLETDRDDDAGTLRGADLASLGGCGNNLADTKTGVRRDGATTTRIENLQLQGFRNLLKKIVS